MAASNVDAQLEIIPESVMEFVLSEREATPKVTMTLRHPDKESGPVAFKVRSFGHAKRSQHAPRYSGFQNQVVPMFHLLLSHSDLFFLLFRK